MKKVNFKYSALWLLLLALVTSCVFDEADPLVENTAPQDPVMVTFKLDVMSSAATKADDLHWYDAYAPKDPGNEFENKIIASDLKIMAYSAEADGAFIKELPVVSSMPVRDSEGKITHYIYSCIFNAPIPQDASVSNPPEYRFMVFANCINNYYRLSYTNGIPEVGKLTYDIPDNILSEAIPMWGVNAYEFRYDSNGQLLKNQDFTGNDYEAVDLLRATAKIGVKLSEDLKDKYELVSLKINRIASSGYSLPKNWNSKVKTNSFQHAPSFNPVETGDADKDFIGEVNDFIYDEETDEFYIYVPETRNIKDNDDEEIAIELNIRDKSTLESLTFDYSKGLKFRTYSNGVPEGDPYDILRNHYYQYTINDIVLGDLFLTLRVADWDDAPVWDVDFEAPLHTNLMTSPSKTADAPQGVPQVYYDNSDPTGLTGAFVGYFSMDSPKGVTWKPTLANVSAGDYEVRVYTNIDQNGNVRDTYDILVTDANIEAKIGRFYKIVVVAKNPNNVGTVVKLGLSYAPLWNHEANPLLVINKKGDGLYYPWNQQTGDTSSDSPDISWISIRQVTKP